MLLLCGRRIQATDDARQSMAEQQKFGRPGNVEQIPSRDAGDPKR